MQKELMYYVWELLPTNKDKISLLSVNSVIRQDIIDCSKVLKDLLLFYKNRKNYPGCNKLLYIIYSCLLGNHFLTLEYITNIVLNRNITADISNKVDRSEQLIRISFICAVSGDVKRSNDFMCKMGSCISQSMIVQNIYAMSGNLASLKSYFNRVNAKNSEYILYIYNAIEGGSFDVFHYLIDNLPHRKYVFYENRILYNRCCKVELESFRDIVDYYKNVCKECANNNPSCFNKMMLSFCPKEWDKIMEELNTF